MNRSYEPAANFYDIMGVPANAGHEDIRLAFDRLIRGEGYREGVPLRAQWQRAREIKAAYATLGVPSKRRAYDEQLSLVPAETAPWAAQPASGAGTLERAPSAVEPRRTASPAAAGASMFFAREPVEASAAAAPAREAASARPPVRHRVIGGDNEPVPSEPDEIAGENEAVAIDDPALAPDLEQPSRNRAWGIAAGGAIAFGLVALMVGIDRGAVPSVEEGARLADAAVDSPGMSPAIAGVAAPADRSVAQAAAAQEPGAAAPVARTDPREPVSGTAADVRIPEGVALAQAQPRPTIDASVVAAAQPAIAAGVPAEGGVAQPQAVSGPPVLAAPPLTQVGSGALTARQVARRAVHTPAQWMSGGPTDADNRPGRYRGEVMVQVTVKPDGRVSNCAAVRGSGNAELDALTCRLLSERARFQPATDADGQPVRSNVQATYVWGQGRRK